MVIVISPVKAIVGYLCLSIAILAFANPGYGAASGFAILLGGAAGSLKLFVELMPDVFYEDLALGRQFSKETLIAGILALLLWIVGGVLLFFLTRAKRKVGYAVATVAVWVGASFFSIFCFAMRSL